MSTVKFSREQFEAALPVHKDTGAVLWVAKGLVDGEYTYQVPVNGDGKVFIEVRSSVKSDGFAADTGADSIRAWLVNNNGKPLGSKVNAWTTRQPGWEGRMVDVLRTLYRWRLKAKDCPVCGEPKGIYKVRKQSQNKGRVFAKCQAHGGFVWLDGDGEAKPSLPSQGGEGAGASVASRSPQAPSPSSEPKAEVNLFNQLLGGEPQEPEEPKAPEPKRKPNAEQKAAIESPIDGATRVIAPPGSGKTFVIAHRYAYMLSQGVKPENILAVTFSRTMADELLARIIKVNPSVVGTAAEQQVCTIHAACFRILKDEGERKQVLPPWKCKSILQDIIDKVWPESEQPGWDEVLSWICTAKSVGLKADQDRQFYVSAMGSFHGERLHKARVAFDAQLKAENGTTFSDMVFDVEVKLREDAAFRNRYQTKFEHVIIDEAQDTSAQAMRILITLSCDPGQNPIYGEEA